MAIQNGIIMAYLLSLTATCDAFGFAPSPSLRSSPTAATTDAGPTISDVVHHRHRLPRIHHRDRFVTAVCAEPKDDDEESVAEEDNKEGKEKEKKAAKAAKAAPATDILSSPSFLKKKLDVLTSDVAAVEEKSDAANEVYKANKEEWGPQIDQLKSEYSNIENRFQNMSKGETNTATMEVARKLLEVLDNFDRAFSNIKPSSPEEEAVEASYKESYAAVLTAFKTLGVEEVETVGKEFDYEFHSAVMTRPDEEHEEGVVCEELAKGYVMEDGKLIRAAMVVVAA